MWITNNKLKQLRLNFQNVQTVTKPPYKSLSLLVDFTLAVDDHE